MILRCSENRSEAASHEAASSNFTGEIKGGFSFSMQEQSARRRRPARHANDAYGISTPLPV